jgi:pumilio RNA-binding family
VLQRAFEHCTEAQARPLLDELHHEAYALMQHQYGNYVIQWVLQRGQPNDRAQVIAKIRGNVLTLSRHKFASNVIEEVIRTSSAADLDALVDEILTPKQVPSAGADAEAAQQTTKIAPAVLMMKDQFANYVLQRFLEKADGAQRARLVEAVQPSLLSARRLSSAHQTKHLVAIERLIESLAEQTAAAEAATAA